MELTMGWWIFGRKKQKKIDKADAEQKAKKVPAQSPKAIARNESRIKLITEALKKDMPESSRINFQAELRRRKALQTYWKEGGE